MGLLKFLVYTVIFFFLAGKFFTNSFTWGYEGKWTNIKTFFPVSPLTSQARAPALHTCTRTCVRVRIARRGPCFSFVCSHC